MKKLTIATLVVSSILGTGIVYAQSLPDLMNTANQRRIHPHREHPPLIDTQRLTAEAEARVAAARTAMRLNAQQDKLWGPLASALRDFGQLRIDRANARMESANMQPPSTRQSARDRRNAAATDSETLLRQRAESAAAESKALTMIADAAEPLTETLNARQKRALSSLIRRETSWRHPVLGERSSRHPFLGQHPIIGQQETAWEHPVLGK